MQKISSSIWWYSGGNPKVSILGAHEEGSSQGKRPAKRMVAPHRFELWTSSV